MELRHLRYFVAVAEDTTLVAASRRLGVAQPALTRQIHAFERELDVELLARGPKGVTLTPAGEVALASARHVLREVDAAAEQARGSGAGTAGRCVVCAGARALASGLLGRLIERLRERFPAIDIGVTEGALDEQLRAVRLGEADVGIGLPVRSDDPDLVSETFDVDDFDAVIVADAHPIARHPHVPLAALANETFISYRSDVASEFTRRIATEFARVGFTPAAVREYDHIFAVAAAVEAGQGWTLLYREGAALAPRGTTIVPLEDFRVPLPHALVRRADERRPVVHTVIRVVRELAAEEEARALQQVDSPPPPLERPDDVEGPRPSSVLELRHLRYFCAVVEAGTFGRAAEQLGITQPALSRQVGDLERVVGVALLDRTARGVTSTPAGDAFARSARRILDEVHSLTAEVQRARRGVSALCRIATVPTPAARKLVTALLRECAQDLPDLELMFQESSTPIVPAELRAGHVDLGVVHSSPIGAAEERGIERRRLTFDLMNCALVAEGSPLARRRELALRDLADVPFLFADRSFQPALYDEIFDLFAQLGFRPRVDATYKGLRTVWTLVAEGHGWGMGFASQCDSPPSGTVAVPLSLFSIPWGLDLLVREDEARPLVQDVADRLQRLASLVE